LILERVCVDIVEEVKRVNRIEDVMEETGGLLIHKHGRYLRGREHDSLVVDTHEQYYTWNSQNETGDVISWLERRKKWDFKTAVEWLAQRAHLPIPEWGQENNATRLAVRTREDALTVAARVFVKWLRSSPAAAAYVNGRGWTEETVRAAGLGYTGGGTSEERTDLEGELNMHAFETNNPGKRAALQIPGGMLVYAHVLGGRVRYLSCRAIGEKRHYNLPKDLGGPRQVYFNHEYSSRAEECVIVEGQADAVTLGQWGLAAVALAGTGWKDARPLLEELTGKHKTLYLGLDADQAGEKALRGNEDQWELAFVLGPMARVVKWGMEGI